MRTWQMVCLALIAGPILLSGCAQRPAPQTQPADSELETTQPGFEVVEADPQFTWPGQMSETELAREPLRYYLDIPYAANNNVRQQLDIYIPENPNYVPLPVILYIHGGNWAEGDKADAPRRLLPFLRSGDFAVVSVGYRLTDEAQWPAQLHDIKAAIRYIRARAEDYGLDPQRIALWGRDSGGHLALMAGITNQAQDMAGNLGAFTYIRSDVSAVVNYGGVSNINALLEQNSNVDRAAGNSPEARLIGGLIRENNDIASAASPVHYIRDSAPPILTIHGTRDSVVPYEQARGLHRRLDEAGTEHYLIDALGAEYDALPAEADARALQFFERILLGRSQRVDTSSIQ